jgi:hypothetical protein
MDIQKAIKIMDFFWDEYQYLKISNYVW